MSKHLELNLNELTHRDLDSLERKIQAFDQNMLEFMPEMVESNENFANGKPVTNIGKKY
jgi:hypothetical protein